MRTIREIMRELSHSRRRMAAATLNGRLPITLTGGLAMSDAKSIARKSALTTRTAVSPAKRSFSGAARRGSNSTNVSERGRRAAIFPVRMPRPGPISMIASDSFNCAAATIRSATPALVKKFCPRDLAGRTPARASADAGRDGVSRSLTARDFRCEVTARDWLLRRCRAYRARRAAGGSCPRARSLPRCRCST